MGQANRKELSNASINFYFSMTGSFPVDRFEWVDKL